MYAPTLHTLLPIYLNSYYYQKKKKKAKKRKRPLRLKTPNLYFMLKITNPPPQKEEKFKI